MAKFTTRVELYGTPDGEDYDELHKAMEAEGFSRTISWEDDSNIYHLPNAEYNRTSDLTIHEIRDSAVAAAKKAWTEFGVLVTKADGPRSKHNLKVKKAK